MHPFDELKAYVGFGPEDEQRLRVLLPYVQPSTRAIADRFYDRILQFEGAAEVFEDRAQVERLKVSLRGWIVQLLSGPWDHAYFELRRRIGRAHVRVRLPSQYMFTAMNRLMEELHAIARDAFPREAAQYSESLRRIADIELAVILRTYIEERELRGLEDLRELIVSHLPMTVLLLDSEQRVVSSTSPHTDFFVDHEFTGRAIDTVLRREVVQAVDIMAQLARAAQSKREIVVPRVDTLIGGRRRALRISVVPLEHELANALVHIEDLTETVAFESRVRHAEHLAKLGTLAASVAHEIRNPLAGISGTVQYIAASFPEGDDRRAALKKVQEQIARLGALVGDLLSFSRPITAQARRVDLAEVAVHVVAQANASEGRAATLQGEGMALADATLVGEVLLNLVLNAWQAGAEDVVLQVEPGRVCVCDDGPGIPEENRTRVFEPFFTTKVRGTGLGLPMAQKLVEAMRGTLELVPSPLGGAAFEMRLPLDEIG